MPMNIYVAKFTEIQSFQLPLAGSKGIADGVVGGGGGLEQFQALRNE